MNLSLPEFKCRVGECTYCCTDMPIPVTIGDFYRHWKVRSNGKSDYPFSQVIKEIVEGFGFKGVANGDPVLIHYIQPPCMNLSEKGLCNKYGIRFISCALYPEILHPDMGIYSGHFNSLEKPGCLENTTLSADTKRRIEIAYNRIFEPEILLWTRYQDSVNREGFEFFDNPSVIKDLEADPEFQDSMNYYTILFVEKNL